MRDEIYELDSELSQLRRRINRAEKWGVSKSEADVLKQDSLRLLSRARKVGYYALGLRALERFANNPYGSRIQKMGGVVDGSHVSDARRDSTARRSAYPGGDSGRSKRAIAPSVTPLNSAAGSVRASSSSDSTSRIPEKSSIKEDQNSNFSQPISENQERDPLVHSKISVPKPSDLNIGKRNITSRNSDGMRADASSRNGRASYKARAEWSVDSYRTFLSAAPGTEFKKILREVQGWIDSKNLGVSLRQNEKNIAGDHRFVAETQRAEKDGEIYRLHLVESPGAENPRDPTFSTTIVLHDGVSPWIWIDIQNDKNQYVQVPRIAKSLMNSFQLFDGGWRMHSKTSLLEESEVEGLIQALGSPTRWSPLMLVGSTDDSELQEAFRAGMDEWGAEVFGIGGVAILDPDATERFNKEVPSGFNVSPWAIRTFQPGLEFGVPESANRHRFLGTSRLIEDRPGKVSNILGSAARSQVATHPTPRIVLDALRTLEMDADQRLLRRIRFDSQSSRLEARKASAVQLFASVTDGTELESLRMQIESVKLWLEIPEINDENLLAAAEALENKRKLDSASADIENRINELQEANFELEERASYYEELSSEYDDELAESELELSKLRQSRAKLQSRLAEYEATGDSIDDLNANDIFDTPENLELLVDRLVDLEVHGVEFTGDVRAVEALEKSDTNGRIVNAVWECLLTCVEYLRAKQDGKFSGGMHEFLSRGPEGYIHVSPSRHAARESESTENQYGRDRVFPVPSDVDPSGEIYMGAHFKMPKLGILTPRMHYFDDSANSNKVYVGYIGRHLRTQGTN